MEGISADANVTPYVYILFSFFFFLISILTDAMIFVYHVIVSFFMFKGIERRGSEVKRLMD